MEAKTLNKNGLSLVFCLCKYMQTPYSLVFSTAIVLGGVGTKITFHYSLFLWKMSLRLKKFINALL